MAPTTMMVKDGEIPINLFSNDTDPQVSLFPIFSHVSISSTHTNLDKSMLNLSLIALSAIDHRLFFHSYLALHQDVSYRTSDCLGSRGLTFFQLIYRSPLSFVTRNLRR